MSDTKPLVALNVAGIPADLRAMPQWVAWAIKPPKKPGDKFGKIPINPNTGNAGSSTNPKTWSTFPVALQHMERDHLPGVGFVFTDSGYFGVDLDKCRDAITGVVEPWALEIVEKLDTYTEISPSGTGLHLIGRGAIPPGGKRKDRIEMYDTGRFFTITGVVLADTRPEVAERQDAINALHADVFCESKEPRGVATAPIGAPVGPGIDDDERLIERASKAKNGAKFTALFGGDISGYASQSEAELALCSILSFHTNGDAHRIDRMFRRSGLMRPKWDEQHGERTYGAMTIEKAIASHKTRSRTKPAAEVRFIGQFRPCTDSGNAERFVDQFGDDMRHAHAWKKWLIYSQGRWKLDDEAIAMLRSKQIARLILAEAAACDDQKVREGLTEHSRKSEKAERRKAMIDLARCEPRIPIPHTALDQHPYLFNCRNGTLNLETFELQKHDPKNYLTKICPIDYVPDAQYPLWLATLERALPDPRVREYMQRYCGYALTGDVSEQVLQIALGVGANGKSTIMNAFSDVMSSAYAIQISTDMLLAKDRESHPTDIADLFGVRLAIGTEIPKGRALDERLLKLLTGGEPIRARRMREDFWQFSPTHKFILVANHMPKVSVDDYAVTRRLHVVRFDVTIPELERDKQLVRKLRAEREGILAWAVEGRRMQLEHGLAPPEEVLVQPTTADAPKPPPAEFISVYVVREPGSRTRASALYDAFKAWCALGAKPVASQQDFGLQLGRMGFGRTKSDGLSVYVDTLLRPVREEQGPQGPLFPLNALSTPREGVNGESGPSHPYPSLNGSAAAQDAPLNPCGNAVCRACGGACVERAGAIVCTRCGVCEPVSGGPANGVRSVSDAAQALAPAPAATRGSGVSRTSVIAGPFGAMQNPEAH